MRGGEERLGPYVYRWSEKCFPLGADSLALGEFATVKPGDRVVDLGCGAGLLLLLCARRQEGLTLTGVELDPAAAGEARENLARNGLGGEIFNRDFCDLPGELRADLVISNPPWYPADTGKAGGPGRMEGQSLERLCQAAAGVLGHRGRFALVHRAQRAVDVLVAMRGAGLEPKRIQFCRGRPDKAPYAVLVEGVKGGRPGVEILGDRVGDR